LLIVTVGRISHSWTLVRTKIMFWPTVSRPVCLGVKHPSGAYDQIYITVRLLRVCWCGALSLKRERVWRLQLLLVFTSAVILGSGTRDHILLSQIWYSHPPGGSGPRIYIPQEQGGSVIAPGTVFPFRRLLRWKYSNPPPRGVHLLFQLPPYNILARTA
jgi:hypothetical protein